MNKPHQSFEQIKPNRKKATSNHFIFKNMGFLTFSKKFDLVDNFFCSKNICKLSCASSVVFIFFLGLRRNCKRHEAAWFLGTASKSNVSSPWGTYSHPCQGERRPWSTACDFLYPSKKSNVSDGKLLSYPVLFRREKKKLQLVQSGYLFDRPKP